MNAYTTEVRWVSWRAEDLLIETISVKEGEKVKDVPLSDYFNVMASNGWVLVSTTLLLAVDHISGHKFLREFIWKRT